MGFFGRCKGEWLGSFYRIWAEGPVSDDRAPSSYFLGFQSTLMDLRVSLLIALKNNFLFLRILKNRKIYFIIKKQK